MKPLYPHPDPSTSSPCAIAAIEYVIRNARTLSPVLPVDLNALGAFKIPYDQLLAAVIAQAKEVCTLRAKLERVGQQAEEWCEKYGLDNADMIEELTICLLDEDK